MRERHRDRGSSLYTIKGTSSQAEGSISCLNNRYTSRDVLIKISTVMTGRHIFRGLNTATDGKYYFE